LFDDIVTPVFIGAEFCIQKVREEEDLKNGKHDEKFDQDDGPERAPDGHTFKTLEVEPEDAADYVTFHRSCFQLSKLAINKGHFQSDPYLECSFYFFIVRELMMYKYFV